MCWLNGAQELPLKDVTEGKVQGRSDGKTKKKM